MNQQVKTRKSWLKLEGRKLVISGPCSAESEEQILETARALAQGGHVDYFRAGVWKPRTMPGSFEGIGKEALQWLKKAKEETGLKITVEVATPQHVYEAIKAGVDVLWIGARTTVNPFAVQDIADAVAGLDIPIFIKNPINPDIKLWMGAVERFKKAGITRIGLVHRGFSYLGETKYRNRPQWQIPIEMMVTYPDLPMICDPSHICGNRTMLHEVAQKAIDLNFDGVMLESHPNPDEAWSDAKQQVTPSRLNEILDQLVLRESRQDDELIQNNLELLRGEIDEIDADLLAILGKRMNVAKRIGHFKKERNITILQQARWEEIVQRFIELGLANGLSRSFAIKLITAIHDESINNQEKIFRSEE
ncbi:MAG TPA: 3-deoxy-7-phosphoheptulonate synthase [Saprospiraceae bacterium]|nr:3-deoxy-7-phosphoheptulonate synthase [Saprospiraceae bacterium]